MKKILVIADGILAKHFLERVFKIKNVIHNYTIVSYQNEITQNDFSAANFKFHHFDPTSLEKFKNILNLDEFYSCIVIMDNEFDTITTYKNLKIINPELEIYLLDMWNAAKEYKDDSYLKIIDLISETSSRLIGFLPDNPIYANNIGLGKGEIMEVKVPAGSSFAYKKVGLISQNRYKIPMIYRHSRSIITDFNTIILPNDTILVVGEPSTLRGVFSAIKKEQGQFPSPFGLNIYILADMKNMNKDKLKQLLKVGDDLNSKLKNHKIYIRVINPTLSPIFEEIKKLNTNSSYEILIDYKNADIRSVHGDIVSNQIGLILLDSDFFELHKNSLYNLKIPIMTIGEYDFSEITKGVIVSSSHNANDDSSVVFDVCGQFDLDVYLYSFTQNFTEEEKLINHYKNLSKLFKKDLHVVDNAGQNPILQLEKNGKFLQFVPFTEKILKRNIASVFSKDFDELYYKLDHNYQLFIPSEYKID